jgi:hypothetical protein
MGYARGILGWIWGMFIENNMKKTTVKNPE